MKKLILASIIVIFSFRFATSQVLTQNVKGKVLENETQIPIAGATVIILGTDPLLGTTTDAEGNYKISNVPLGRYNIQFNFMGYNPVLISEVLVTSAKEVVVNAGLKQMVTKMDEVTVKSTVRKDQPINTMASISVRSFTVEETRRYAGGLDDPARLASSFAGVTVGNIQDNAIIIRGNSPKGVSWRLEGVEIPNPNHFAGGNVAGGGAVTIFSSQLLANSDFFTGAFPAEYGNALAGVFDMKLRNGNNEQRESTVQIGMLGIDVSSEGPFVKGRNATYLFNYRYSTFGLISNLGIIPSDQVPKYQDLSFKLNFPLKKAGNLSFWGIGALDVNEEYEEPDSTKWETDWDRIKYKWNLNMGATGLTHKIIVGKNTYVNTSVVCSGVNNKMNATRLDSNLILRPNWYFTDNSAKTTVSSFINHKFNAKFTLKTGLNFNQLFYNINLNSTINDVPGTFQNFVKQDGQSSYTEYFVQSKYDINSKLFILSGINASFFALNNHYSIDPRFSIKWEFSPSQYLSFGYGKHSQLEELKIYLISKDMNGTTEYPNKNLGFSHAQHFVLGYDWNISDHLHLKVEPYFQYLYDIPGIPDSSYSLINFKQDWSFMDSLSNNSVGKNMGIDITFERYLYHNFYYLITASIFNSTYKGDDGIWRKTRYDKGYAFNFLLGKEFFMNKNRIFGLNARFNYMGGERISPVLVNESLERKTVIYDETRAFENQLPPTFYLDLSLSYRINKKSHSSIWTFQLKNALGSPSYDGYSYNYKTNLIQREKYTVVLPVLSYKIEF